MNYDLCDHSGQETAPACHSEVSTDREMTTSEPGQFAVFVDTHLILFMILVLCNNTITGIHFVFTKLPDMF